ncbi:MAG: YafY family protein [Tepidiformaceae bacterium]
MRRADRLFQIIHLLRRRHVVTAAFLARELEVSERTVYRDIRDLVGTGVPIDGEAGVGYTLRRGFDLPPLMFTEPELEAMVLGARVVSSWGDQALGRAARDALARVESALPDRLREKLTNTPLFAPGFHVPAETIASLTPLRVALEERRIVWMRYEDAEGVTSERTLRPVGLFFWGYRWSLSAWCELRQAFRSFRLDRIRQIDVREERFTPLPGQTLEDLFKVYEAEKGQPRDD